MGRKFKFILAAILALSLCGCRKETPSPTLDTVSESVSETVSETAAASETTSPKTETSAAEETTAVTTETSEEREDISEEQAALEKLIAETSETDGEILNPLFDDFDGDGVNELIAVYGDNEINELWFASGSKAYKLDALMKYDTYGSYAPYIVKSAGNAYLIIQHYYPGPWGGINGNSTYFFIKNSAACKLETTITQSFAPDGDFGDVTGYKFTYIRFEYDEHHLSWAEMPTQIKKQHYIIYDKLLHEYSSKEITREDFLKYDGAAEVLDKITADGYEVNSIFKYGSGIININQSQKAEHGEDFYHTAALYRNGKIFPAERQAGTYDSDEENYNKTLIVRTDFEDFCEMIYDTAEGNENSFVRERFYGNIGGKNALYAYYGADENFSLWYADKDGAKKVTEDISLFTADGDVLMQNGGEYSVVKNGKSKKLDTMNAEEFAYQSDGVFTGYVTVGYTDSTKETETRKLYWFRYKDGEISDVEGVDITEEDLLAYSGGRAALDEIAARGGDLVNIVRRDNGIININYALHNQTVTKRFFMTLEIGEGGKLTDITPVSEDGTPDNAGWYLHSLKNT